MQALLLPTPQDADDNDPNYYFSGQVNARPGFALPIAYGDVLIRGRAVSVFAESTSKRTLVTESAPVDALKPNSPIPGTDYQRSSRV